MKVPKTFVPENNERLEEKAKNYLSKVEPAQKPYDEEELGIGATATLPEFFEVLEKSWEEGIKKGILNDSTNKYKFAFETLNKIKKIKNNKILGIGVADTPSKYAGLSVEELEKKILEDYTVVQ